MLRNSFVILDGIGRVREGMLWREGILSWEDFVERRRLRGISEEKKQRMDIQLISAGERLKRRDSSYFDARLTSADKWRCFGEFSGSAVYLDIETTGISIGSPITVVGVYEGSRQHLLVRGQNLSRCNLEGLLSAASMIVTYNGSGFDLPVIEAQFPGVVPRVPHVDLRHPLRRLGLVGGLKSIERELGIVRDERVEYMTGEDAAYLWKLWEKHGNRNALSLLLEYNSEDCRNLRPLMTYAYTRLKRRTFGAATAAGKG